MQKNKLKIKNVKKLILQCFIILFGTFIMSFGYIVFLSPHNIVPGGFMGLARIIHDLLSNIGFELIPTYLWYLILNIFLYIYSVYVLGLEFGIRSGVGIFSYSIFTSIIEKFELVSKINAQFEAESGSLGGGIYILYAIYGGLLMGIGIGFVFRGDGSTGGCDMVAVVTNRFFPSITTGQIIMFVDALVVILSSFTYGSLVLPLYALITIFVCGKISDVFVDGVKSLRAYYIVTNKKEEIAEKILFEVKRGVTNIKCEGMYSHTDKDMLLVVLRKSQIMKLKRIVKEIDPECFMFSHAVNDIRGKGFYENTKNKKISKSKMKFLKYFRVKKRNYNVENIEKADNNHKISENDSEN